MNLPQLTPAQLKRSDLLAGLPFVTIADPLHDRGRIVGQLLNGKRLRADDVEHVWNQALVIDALEEPGAWQDHWGTPEQIEILIHAEKLYGCDIVDALPVYLRMPKTTYGSWEHRPRVKWPRPISN